MWSLYTAIVMPIAETDCLKQVESAAIETGLFELEKAFVAKDIAGVRQAYHKTSTSMACLNEPISFETAKKYHLFSGLIAWLNKDKETFKSHVTWLKTMDSSSKISDTLFPKGHVIHKEFLATPVSTLAANAKKPKVGQVYIDGVNRGKRVDGTPTIFQIKNQSGVWQTSILPPTQPLPSYPVDSFKAQAFWTAAGTATIGLGLFATAFMHQLEYNAITDDGITARDREALTSAFEQNQKFGIAAYTLTGISVAIGTWALLQD